MIRFIAVGFVMMVMARSFATDYLAGIGVGVGSGNIWNRNKLYVAAREDRKRFPFIDSEGNEVDNPYVFYLVANTPTAQLLGFLISSASQQQNLDSCLPQNDDENSPIHGLPLWRIDLRLLRWSAFDWEKVLLSHPYGGHSLLIRGDWLVRELTDSDLSAETSIDGVAAFDRLFYGKNRPKTEAELFAFFGVFDDLPQVVIDSKSPVAISQMRWIEYLDRKEHGDMWYTRDSKRLDSFTSPIERPEGDFIHDGSEYIIGIRKHSLKTNQVCRMQVYALGQPIKDEEGNIIRTDLVHEAPVDLVKDYLAVRGITAIRDQISCINCHVEGIRPMDSSAFVNLVNVLGVVPGRRTQEELEELQRKHYASLSTAQKRAQEDYELAVKLHTGWTVEQMTQMLRTVVDGYDANLTIADAAIELGTTVDHLKEVLINHSRLEHNKQAFSAAGSLLGLVGGDTCPRALFEEQYPKLDALLKGK